MIRQSYTTWLGVAFLAFLLPVIARADSYYVVIFGAQRPYVNNPTRTHSFATFIQLTSAGGVQYFTISWLPTSAQLKLLKPAELGRNYTLEETLEYCRKNRMEVSVWGPYQIEPDLFDRAILQKTRLERGEVLYKMFDCGSLTGVVSNCVHSLAFMVREPGDMRPYVSVLPGAWGESGSYWVALGFRPWYVDPCKVHHWLMPRIGLDPHAFPHNQLDRNPSPNPVTRGIQATFHMHLLQNRVRCPWEPGHYEPPADSDAWLRMLGLREVSKGARMP